MQFNTSTHALDAQLLPTPDICRATTAPGRREDSIQCFQRQRLQGVVAMHHDRQGIARHFELHYGITMLRFERLPFRFVHAA